MKILITGSEGQLGKQIIKSAPKNVQVIGISRKDLDLINYEKCYEKIIKEKPNWIINTAAYTNVDRAESEKELAMKINAKAPLAFSKALKITGGKLLQISTDYVFNGNQQKPYPPDHERSPINFYGYSKALGEKNIIEEFGIQKNYLILRTSWLMGPIGKNFLLTMLSLNKTKDSFRVVSDQFGCLTSTLSLADACWELIQKYTCKIFHSQNHSVLHFANIGKTSWYEIAVEIGNLAFDHGLINKKAKVYPIKSNDYITQAKRPMFSVLESDQTYQLLNLKPISWKKSLEDIIKEIKAINNFGKL